MDTKDATGDAARKVAEAQKQLERAQADEQKAQKEAEEKARRERESKIRELVAQRANLDREINELKRAA